MRQNIVSKNLGYEPIDTLDLGYPDSSTVLPAEEYAERLYRMTEKMDENDFDAVVIYGDKEHFSNFKYFVGFDPRFEESLIVIHRDGRAFAALGNECMGQAERAMIPLIAVLCQVFSLPN